MNRVIINVLKRSTEVDHCRHGDFEVFLVFLAVVKDVQVKERVVIAFRDFQANELLVEHMRSD